MDVKATETAHADKKLLLLSSKDYENCVKAHKRRKSCTQKRKKRKKNGNHEASTGDRNKTIPTKAREKQKLEQMRASEAREGEKQNESNERARARGERERQEEVWFRRTDGRDGRNRRTNERTDECLGRSFQPDFGHV